MNKTSIEWVRNPNGTQGYTSNPIKGICKGNCFYCYSRKFYKRFKWNPKTRLDKKELVAPLFETKSFGIFLGSMHDIFGPWIQKNWVDSIFRVIKICPQHRFYLLTKFPENVTCQKFHKHRVMPRNVWFGITITGEDYIEDQRLILELRHVEAKIKFISFEPLLGPLADNVANAITTHEIDWIIIGARTQPLKLPERKWVDDIQWFAGHTLKSKIPLFIKNNLKPLLGKNLRQEFPR